MAIRDIFTNINTVYFYFAVTIPLSQASVLSVCCSGGDVFFWISTNSIFVGFGYRQINRLKFQLSSGTAIKGINSL